MKTVGETLQSVRLKRGLTLEDVSELTKIKLEFLQAIEAGEFGELPSPAITQGFISSFADVLGIEPKTALSLLRRDYAVTKVSVLPKHLAEPTQKKNRRRSNFRFVLGLSFLGVLLIATYFVWSYTQLNRPPKLVLTAPKDGATVSSTFVVRGWTASDATLTIDTQPVALTQDGEFAQEITLSTGDHSVTVVAANRKKQETIQQLFLHVE